MSFCPREAAGVASEGKNASTENPAQSTAVDASWSASARRPNLERVCADFHAIVLLGAGRNADEAGVDVEAAFLDVAVGDFGYDMQRGF
jgi:hypothetical protein